MLKNAQKDFIQRHIGPSKEEQKVMLKELGYNNLDELIAEFCKGSVDKRIVYFRDEVLTDRLGSTLYSDPKPNFSELY